MAAVVMQKRLVSKVLVGADRIALNGDFANKVGTYGLSVSCRHHRIPLIVAAPYTTIDFTIATGDDIEIENRDAHEVRSDWAPSDAPVFNPAFDVTPAANVDYWVFDRAVYSRQDVQNGAIARLKVN
jgi:methylthioribose-1-phosphate isomerase